MHTYKEREEKKKKDKTQHTYTKEREEKKKKDKTQYTRTKSEEEKKVHG